MSPEIEGLDSVGKMIGRRSEIGGQRSENRGRRSVGGVEMGHEYRNGILPRIHECCCHECTNGLRVLGSWSLGVPESVSAVRCKTCTSLIVRLIFAHSWQLNMRRHDERTFELANGGQLAGMGGQFAGICTLFVFLFGLLFSGLVCIMERALRLYYTRL